MLILNFLDTLRIIIYINILLETVVSFLSLQLVRASSPYIPKRLRQVSYLDMIGRKQQPWSTHCKKKNYNKYIANMYNTYTTDC